MTQAVQKIDGNETKETKHRNKFVVFQNKGIIDTRAITTFGISAKDPSNPNPIGYFGTGLKYAIAVLLREGFKITIWAGHEKLEFTEKKEEVRGEIFNIVCMNGQPLGFTTSLGKKWELWQAFREIYSNCLDESGDTYSSDEIPDAQEFETLICVEGEAFVEVYEARNEIFIQGDPLCETNHAKIHGGSSNHVFYRGVRIATFKNPLMYRYNISNHLDLTEDRTIKYNWQINDTIVDTVLSSDDEKFIKSILTASEDKHEAHLDFTDNRSQMSETFRNVIGELRRTRPEKTNKSAQDLFERNLKAVDKFQTYKLNEQEHEAYIKAVDFLAELGYPVEKYQVIFCLNLGESTLAMVEDKKIYISSRVFHMGSKMLAATLFEEYVHAEFGYSDCSREMQNYLFESFISMGEKLTGKVL